MTTSRKGLRAFRISAAHCLLKIGQWRSLNTTVVSIRSSFWTVRGAKHPSPILEVSSGKVGEFSRRGCPGALALRLEGAGELFAFAVESLKRFGVQSLSKIVHDLPCLVF